MSNEEERSHSHSQPDETPSLQLLTELMDEVDESETYTMRYMSPREKVAFMAINLIALLGFVGVALAVYGFIKLVF